MNHAKVMLDDTRRVTVSCAAALSRVAVAPINETAPPFSHFQVGSHDGNVSQTLVVRLLFYVLRGVRARGLHADAAVIHAG